MTRASPALDKLETFMQHNRGRNLDGFDYEFNLSYGKRYTDATPLTSAVRELLDLETATNAEEFKR